MDTDTLIKTLTEALRAASEHLDYCGYGDNWERECAEAQGLEKKIADALAAADAAEAARNPAFDWGGGR